MAKPKKLNNSHTLESETGITQISVSGFKSINREQSIEIRPLTILAGANSSGKSSIMQPLLLMKQTLEASYDPGPLLLDGPNVRFTSLNQLLTKKPNQANALQVDVSYGQESLTIVFKKEPDKGLNIERMTITSNEITTYLHPEMTQDQIMSFMLARENVSLGFLREGNFEGNVDRGRCFLVLDFTNKSNHGLVRISWSDLAEKVIQRIIHLPGLRGNPERTYPLTSVGPNFPGTFENYAASVIAQWQSEKEKGKIEKLSRDFERLGLTWKVTARAINDTQVEIQVGRLPRATKSARDLVSIADVGLGISQTLPVLVALIVAEPGQLVYLEQPELHLHPRAQTALAQILADAARRGVRVVAETHSSLLILGIQTLVAEGQLSPELVKLHWFKRTGDGSTEVQSADLDETGAFGEWPEDFAEVALQAESRYLDAAESKMKRMSM